MNLILNLLPSISSGAENPLSTISKAVGITGTFDTGGNLSVGTSAELLTASTGTTFTCTQGVMVTADSSNSTVIFIGNSDVTAGAADATTGIPISAGESIFFSASGPQLVYVIASSAVADQKVYWLAV